MALVVEYKGYYTYLDIPEQDWTEWKDTLKNECARIYNALKTRIPDEPTFIEKIAEASHEVWRDFVNPNWEDIDLIKIKHRVKLHKAYPAWSNGVDKAFNLETPYFPDRVEGKADKFKLVKVTLGSVGLRYRYGRGIAVKAIGVISNWKAVARDIKSPDEFTGTITNVFLPGAARFVRPQAVAIVTQGLVLASYAHDAGLTSERDAVINAINQKLANTVLKQVDTSTYSVTFEIGYDGTKNQLFVHSKAETVA